jgi:hypothetical protein
VADPARNGTDAQVRLEAPGTRAYVILFLLTVALPTLLGGILPWLATDAPPSIAWLASDSLLVSRLLGAGTILAITLAVYAGIVLLMRRHRLRIDAGGIEVATTFYSRRLRWEQLRLDAARVVDIDERTELKPMLKSNGVAMPGFHSGWFRSRGFNRLLVASAGGKRLLWVPTREGYDLLLQPRKPAVALERMKELAAAMAPGRHGR